MIYLMLDICATSSGLRVMYLVKTLMWAICIIVPILLMVILMIDFVKGVTNKDEDALVILKKKAVPKLIAAIVVFLVPTIVSILMSIIGVQKYHDCFGDVTMDDIKQLEAEEKAERENNETNNGDNGGIGGNGGGNQPNTNKHPEYTSSNSHTNSINGVKYVLYNQCSEPWGSKTYNSGSGTTVCQEGCPMTAAAVVISSYDFNLTPASVYNNNLKNSYVTTITETLSPGAFNCGYASSKTQDGILDELTDGDVIVMRRQKYPETGTGNHWMALIDVKRNDRQVFVGNSYDSGTSSTNRSGWFNISEIVINPQEVFVCKPTQSLINRFK